MAQINQKTILIVEDEYFLAETIKVRLEYMGFAVLLAENGQQALDMMPLQKIDLVLMDIIMPVLDGLKAIRMLREREKYKNLPIIVLTAKARESDREDSMKAGASAYLSKPFEMEDLMQLLRQFIPL
ncbi:MAG: Sensor protein [uncultured bacterium]|nr:MAG: Sensor protein [uncultured bacterium]